jgi:hypothetical protein
MAGATRGQGGGQKGAFGAGCNGRSTGGRTTLARPRERHGGGKLAIEEPRAAQCPPGSIHRMDEQPDRRWATKTGKLSKAAEVEARLE